MISGAQIRAACALLNWSTMALSKRCKIPQTILRAAQAIDGMPNMQFEHLQAIVRAFKEGGVELIGTVGVKYIGSGPAEPPRPVVPKRKGGN